MRKSTSMLPPKRLTPLVTRVPKKASQVTTVTSMIVITQYTKDYKSGMRTGTHTPTAAAAVNVG
jgi:hypothetical protein